MPRFLSKQILIPHPETPLDGYRLGAKLSLAEADTLEIEYVLIGRLDGIAIPAAENPERRDELWRRTCFEVFAARPDGSYVELNFSPSRQWASYRFDSYREGMRIAEDVAPAMVLSERTTDLRFGLIARFGIGGLREWGAERMGLSAVIEAKDGTKSYWALAHPPGKPDFHHPDCFVLELPAARRG